jgi:hypothetical protein
MMLREAQYRESQTWYDAANVERVSGGRHS